MAWNGRYPLIMNPSARSERAQRAQQFIMEHAAEFVIYASASAKDAGNLAKHFADEKEPTVIAAGGDGTINTVVQGLAGSETALGILPTGTMNVFARELGIPSNDLKLALNVIQEGHQQEVDLFQMNGIPFVQMAGVGFDARIIEETSKEQKKLLGPLAYGISAAKIFGESPPHLNVQFEEGHQTEGVCVLVGNGCFYGGQFRLFGNADNADELLDVLVFKEAGYQVVLDFVKGISVAPEKRFTTGSSSIEYFQTKSLKIESDVEVPVEVDGDFHTRTKEISFTPMQSKLRVLKPKKTLVNEWQETLSSLTPFMPWG